MFVITIVTRDCGDRNVTPKEKIKLLASIMNVPEHSVIMDPDSFEIEEIYIDSTQTHHYRVVLKGGTVVAERPKKQ